MFLQYHPTLDESQSDMEGENNISDMTDMDEDTK